MNVIVFHNRLLCGGKKKRKANSISVRVEHCSECFMCCLTEETQQLGEIDTTAHFIGEKTSLRGEATSPMPHSESDRPAAWI